jgi:hypothetical protein
MAPGFPSTPASTILAPSTGHPSFFGHRIALTPQHIRTLRRESLSLTLSLPTTSLGTIPRVVVITRSYLPLRRPGDYARGESFPEGGNVQDASSYHIEVSDAGLKRLGNRQQVYCSLGPEGSFLLEPTAGQRESKIGLKTNDTLK